jgi:hypothetical protein
MVEPISFDEEDSVRNIPGFGYIPPAELDAVVEGVKEELKIQSGVSSIEKSKDVAIPYIPSMSVPFLVPPSQEMGGLEAISSKDASGAACTYVIEKGLNELSNIGTRMVENFVSNLREIEEEVQALLRSPLYWQNVQMLRQGGDQVQAVGQAAAGAILPSNAVSFQGDIASSNRIRILEKISSAAESTSVQPAPAAPARPASVLPLVASVLIGGGLAVGIAQSTTNLAGVSSSPLVDAVNLVSNLQPVFTSISPQDIVPLINLMVIAPIYYHSWIEATSGGATHKDKQKMTETAKKFAEDVIRMVSDPTQVLKQVYGMKGAEQLSLDQKERLANLLRFAMLGTALGMLYAVEVGKVQAGEYRGIMAEEVRDLLFGDLAKPVGQNEADKKPPTPIEQLSLNLAKYASLQLSSLSPDDRVKAATILLDYMEERRGVEHMFDPSNVFQDFYTAFTYHNPAPPHLS